MKTQKFLLKLNNDHPDIWELLEKELKGKSVNKNHNKENNLIFNIDINSYNIFSMKNPIHFKHNYNSFACVLFDIPFYILYAILKKFFKKHGIYIIVYPSMNTDKKMHYDYEIDSFIFLRTSNKNSIHMFKSEKKCKQQALLKACEILNNNKDK